MKKKINIPKVFVGFLIASALIWLLINLSKEYTTVVTYNVDYTNLPKYKLLQSPPLKEVDFLVAGSGFKLLSAKLSAKTIHFNAGNLIRKKNDRYYFLPKNQRNLIQKQLPSGLQLQEVLKDSVFLNLGNLSVKKIPVKANVAIEYQLGYGLSKPIIIQPDTITISGPKMQLQKIETVSTAKLKLDNITKSFKKEIALVIPKNVENTTFETQKVTLIADVDKFTEGEIEVSFLVKNSPPNVVLNTFPKTVKVIYKVGLENFNKITKNSFTVVCDYNQSKKNNISYLIPKIKDKPAIVSSVKIIPDKIEFLIHK
ncbi:CdaR family protein [Tenacibaculum sp. UWU-22]|uniref:CdaR family protein n=1 Tax=Tenacibaculum sp. UWU-22 TaxID=3234187 RepID=UPI0034DB2108